MRETLERIDVCTKMNLFCEVKSVVVPNVIKKMSCASTVFFLESIEMARSVAMRRGKESSESLEGEAIRDIKEISPTPLFCKSS